MIYTFCATGWCYVWWQQRGRVTQRSGRESCTVIYFQGSSALVYHLDKQCFPRILYAAATTHLNAFYSEDEFRYHWWDISLIEHSVRDQLQQRLHWGHTVHDDTPAQETVVEHQKHNPRTHLKNKIKYTQGYLFIQTYSDLLGRSVGSATARSCQILIFIKL